MLIIETAFSFKIHDLPKELIINEKKYRFVIMTSYQRSRNHFISLFELNNIVHYVDSLDNQNTPISQDTNYSQLMASSSVY